MRDYVTTLSVTFDSTGQAPGTYQFRSRIRQTSDDTAVGYSPAGLWPKTFFSVGGYGSGNEAGPELQSKASNEDFEFWLSTLLWSEAPKSSDTSNDFRFCKVDTNKHSQEYVHTYKCEGDLASSGDVLQAMVIFLQGAVV